MDLLSYPLLTYAPLIPALLATLAYARFAQSVQRQLIAAGQANTDVFYAGEERLKALGLHGSVWAMRACVIGQAACILLFVYLVYVAEAG